MQRSSRKHIFPQIRHKKQRSSPPTSVEGYIPLHPDLSLKTASHCRFADQIHGVDGNHKIKIITFQAKKQYDTWTEEDEAGYQIYLQEQDMEKRTYRAWYLIANPRKLPKEIVNQELAFRFKLFPDKMDKKK